MRQIPMLDLKLEYEHMKNEIDGAIKRCIEHQKWILGPEVQELEEKIASYLDVRHCIGISSGTDALALSLRALAIQIKGDEYFSKDDEVLTTPFTFTATGDAILRAGATPVFIDIDPATYNIDPEKIREYITSSPTKVVGILPVHLYGQSCNMDDIMEIAEEHSLFVLEDTAQAFGGAWKENKLGSIGTAGAFSFFPSKNLGGFGDGGMVSTNDDEVAELVRMLVKHGGKDKYNVDHIGYNSRLDTLQAAVLLAKFQYIDEFNERRRHIAEIYTKELSDIIDLSLPFDGSTTQVHKGHVYHQYTIRVSKGKRDALQKHLKERGISTMVYYPLPLHHMKVFGNNRSKIANSLKNSEEACSNVLSLPVEPLMRIDDIHYIIENIRTF
jgi:UDP-2-acetamido-2-deoxy-ribo-hexuluronate aminotransferase